MVSKKPLWDLLVTYGHWVPTNTEPSKAECRGDNRDVDEPFESKLTSMTWMMICFNGFSWDRADCDMIFTSKRDEDSRSDVRFFIHD